MELIGEGDIEVQYEDRGTCIRATGPYNIPKYSLVPYTDSNGNDTGVQFALGTDLVSGDPKVLFVEYPAPPFTLEDVQSLDNVPKFFKSCNVCNALKELKKQKTPSVVQSPDEIYRPVPYSPPAQPPRSQRLSASDLNLPRYIPFAINLVKELWLSDLGKTGVSTAVALGADILSGMNPDPQYQEEMRKLSDWAIDDVVSDMDGKYINNVRDDMGKFVSAYKKDHDLLGAMLNSVVRQPSGNINSKTKSSSSRGQPSRSGVVPLTIRSVID